MQYTTFPVTLRLKAETASSLPSCRVIISSALKVILTAALTQQEHDTLIQSHSIWDVHVTARALSAADIDYCHCLFTLHLSALAVCLFVSCTLLSFVMELLKNSVAMQEQVLSCKGFLVIGHTLEKVRQHQLPSTTASHHDHRNKAHFHLLACYYCVSFSHKRRLTKSDSDIITLFF